MTIKVADKRSKLLFYFAYICYFISSVLSYTQLAKVIPSSVQKYTELLLTLFALSCLAARVIFFERYSPWELFLTVAVAGLLFITMTVSASRLLFLTALFVLCSKNIDFDDFMKLALKVTSCTVLLLALLSLSGVIGMGVKQRDDGTYRYSFGFNHPNHLGMMVFQIEAIYFYLKRHTVTLKKYIIPVAACILCYLISDSSTPTITGIMLIAASFIYERFQKYLRFMDRHVRFFVIAVLIVLAVAMGIMVWYYWNNPYKLPTSMKTLRTRILLAKKYLKAYGVKLFGSNIAIGSNVALPGYGAGYSYLDDGYVRVLVEHGLAVFALICSAIVIYIAKLVKNRRVQLIIITIAFLFFYISEQKVAFITFNAFVVNLGTVLFGMNDECRTVLEEYEPVRSFGKKSKKVWTF